jgi:myo-inositol-1(or 4)-monophosphatase
VNSRIITWPVPDPALPGTVDPVLAEAARAATAAFRSARERFDREELAEKVQMGADGTLTTRLDILVDTAIAEVISRHRVNLLSEEIGVIDNGSALTVVNDPVDGTGNAVTGVPLSAFAAAVCRDGVLTESLTCWLDTGRCWHAVAGAPAAFRTTGRTALDGAAVSLLRPQRADTAAWWTSAGMRCSARATPLPPGPATNSCWRRHCTTSAGPSRCARNIQGCRTSRPERLSPVTGSARQWPG